MDSCGAKCRKACSCDSLRTSRLLKVSICRHPVWDLFLAIALCRVILFRSTASVACWLVFAKCFPIANTAEEGFAPLPCTVFASFLLEWLKQHFCSSEGGLGVSVNTKTLATCIVLAPQPRRDNVFWLVAAPCVCIFVGRLPPTLGPVYAFACNKFLLLRYRLAQE